MKTQRPIKVAIIGGGCAGITAAFELSRPEHNGKYEITVYQLGWRLGGKGASGRGPSARIEEHGFHIWMGCYENSFRLMRECYSELGRNHNTCRISNWRDAFFPAPFLSVTAPSRDGPYSALLSYFPPAEGLPGDPLTRDDPFTVSSYLVHTVSALRAMLQLVDTRALRHRYDGGLPPENRAVGGEERPHSLPPSPTTSPHESHTCLS